VKEGFYLKVLMFVGVGEGRPEASLKPRSVQPPQISYEEDHSAFTRSFLLPFEIEAL
jgi:hypothetical protein